MYSPLLLGICSEKGYEGGFNLETVCDTNPVQHTGNLSGGNCILSFSLLMKSWSIDVHTLQHFKPNSSSTEEKKQQPPCIQLYESQQSEKNITENPSAFVLYMLWQLTVTFKMSAKWEVVPLLLSPNMSQCCNKTYCTFLRYTTISPKIKFALQ